MHTMTVAGLVVALRALPALGALGAGGEGGGSGGRTAEAAPPTDTFQAASAPMRGIAHCFLQMWVLW
jgi:hypothetical protein